MGNAAVSLLLILAVLGGALPVLRFWVRRSCRAEGKRFLRGYACDDQTRVFHSARARHFRGGAKAPHGTLLLHGYSGAPANFGPLFEQLESVGMPYHAPRLSGIGSRDLGMLERMNFGDWLADGLEAHDLMAAHCKEVSVVGYSMGGLLAHLVGERRKVRELIFVNPYFEVGPTDARTKFLALHTPLGPLVRFLRPWFTKSMSPEDRVLAEDPAATRPEAQFHHLSLPSRSLLQVWSHQHPPRPESLQATRIHFVVGLQDTVIDLDVLRQAKDTAAVPIHEHTFPDSPHGILTGPDQDAAATRIVQLLLTP